MNGLQINLKKLPSRFLIYFYISPVLAIVLLTAGCSPSLPPSMYQPVSVTPDYDRGKDALMKAAIDGDLAVVQALLAKGADVNAKNNEGMTALMWAASKGHLPVVQALLDKGADVNAKGNDGWTALMQASNGHLPVVQALLAKGADVNAKTNNGMTTLMWSAVHGDLPKVQALLDKGADVNAKDDTGRTALMVAGLHGHFPVVQALLAKGADVNEKTNDGTTTLMYAVTKGDLPVVQALLDKGADVNAKTNNGVTAVSLAELSGHTKVVNLLRQKHRPHILTRDGSLSRDGSNSIAKIEKLHIANINNSIKLFFNLMKQGFGEPMVVLVLNDQYNDFDKNKNQNQTLLFLESVAAIDITGYLYTTALASNAGVPNEALSIYFSSANKTINRIDIRLAKLGFSKKERNIIVNN